MESILFLSRENKGETKGESKRERASMRVDERGWKKGGDKKQSEHLLASVISYFSV